MNLFYSYSALPLPGSFEGSELMSSKAPKASRISIKIALYVVASAVRGMSMVASPPALLPPPVPAPAVLPVLPFEAPVPPELAVEALLEAELLVEALFDELDEPLLELEPLFELLEPLLLLALPAL